MRGVATNRPKCYGVLAPDRLYTKEGIRRAADLGDESMFEARQSGLVNAYRCGKRVYYSGDEVIAWIKSRKQGAVE